MAGWGDFLGQFMDKLPIQGRIERWKNELENLKKEKAKIEKINLDITNEKDRKKAERYSFIIRRCDYLQQLLENKS